MIMSPIQYVVNVPTSNWSAYFGSYQNQKWGWWDSDSCWALSGINCFEDYLTMLRANGRFSDEAIKFFTDNGYIDSDGDFSLSERFIEIMSTVKDDGNNQMEAGILAQKFGLIPRSMLGYTQAQAYAQVSRASFDADYFNQDAVSTDMLTLGQKFLEYVNISRQWIGTNFETPSNQVLIAALAQAPLQIGVPVPADISAWNDTVVKWDGSTVVAHAVELYAVNADGTYAIYDQYEPHLKTLSADYPLYLVSQYILDPIAPAVSNPVPQPAPQVVSLWTSIFNFFNGIFSYMWYNSPWRSLQGLSSQRHNI